MSDLALAVRIPATDFLSAPMSTARRILLADPDSESARLLGRELRQRGFQVFYAPDGSKALEIAVLRHPDVILFDEGCTLIEAKSFLQIVRANPRTENIPVVLTTRQAPAESFRMFREGVLQKPMEAAHAVAHIEKVVRTAAHTHALLMEGQEIEGELGNLSLVELLQYVSDKQKSGRLVLTQGDEWGEVGLQKGRPIFAHLGPINGEKAFCRLLEWTEGRFSLQPLKEDVTVTLHLSMQEALDVGLRGVTEMRRLRSMLPPPRQLLALTSSPRQPHEQHPVTAAVLAAMNEPRDWNHVLNLVPAPDEEVAGAVLTLLQHGVLQIYDMENAAGKPLWGEHQVLAIRQLATRGRRGSEYVVGKIFLVAQDSPDWVEPLKMFSGFTPSEAMPKALEQGFGTLGRIPIDDMLALDLCLLPTSEGARPLWEPFGQGAVGLIFFDTSKASLVLARILYGFFPVPMVVQGPQVPIEWQRFSDRVRAFTGSCLEALSVLFDVAPEKAEFTSG